MIARASGVGMGVGRYSRPRGGVGVITMPDAGVNTTRRVEDPPGAGVIRVLVPSLAVGICIDRRCVADGVEVTH